MYNAPKKPKQTALHCPLKSHQLHFRCRYRFWLGTICARREPNRFHNISAHAQTRLRSGLRQSSSLLCACINNCVWRTNQCLSLIIKNNSLRMHFYFTADYIFPYFIQICSNRCFLFTFADSFKNTSD